MLSAQDLLQTESFGGKSPRTFLFGPDPDEHHSDAPEAVAFLTWNILALQDELHELLGETGWKPWASQNHVNIDAARGEAIDAWHFLMNIFLALGMDAEMIHDKYMAKRAKNAKRQADGYDGVSTKCPGCHRALDDDGVMCAVTLVGIGWQECYCFETGKTHRMERTVTLG